MSVDRSACATAQESFDRFKANGYNTVAVYGLTVGEFRAENIECEHDPKTENPAHTLADYSTLGTKAIVKAARRLRDLAVNRGQLHPLIDE